RWYGVIFALAFFLGYLIVQRIFWRENKPEKDLGALLGYVLGGTLIGARLGHCFFYEPGYYLSRPAEIIRIWEGGLASHGAAAGILVALYFYTRHRPGQPYLWILDRLAIPAALGGALIRLGNLFNSEILGTPSRLPWAFEFPRAAAGIPLPRHPAMLYEAGAYLLIFLFLLAVYRKQGGLTPPGELIGLFLITVFCSRLLIEFAKERQESYRLPLPLNVGQLLSIPVIIAGAVLLIRSQTKKTPLLNRRGAKNAKTASTR
ncbi:MAG: prolipoprotein diacylglyceryl transferase, partial [PVC group bacterium]